MKDKERVVLLELLRNNPELPVFSKMDNTDIAGDFLLPLEHCHILEYADVGGMFITRSSRTESLVPEDAWKPAICLIIPGDQKAGGSVDEAGKKVDSKDR